MPQGDAVLGFDAANPYHVSAIDPLEYLLRGDLGLPGEVLASSGVRHDLQESAGRTHAGACELLRIRRTDASIPIILAMTNRNPRGEGRSTNP